MMNNMTDSTTMEMIYEITNITIDNSTVGLNVLNLESSSITVLSGIQLLNVMADSVIYLNKSYLADIATIVENGIFSGYLIFEN